MVDMSNTDAVKSRSTAVAIIHVMALLTTPAIRITAVARSCLSDAQDSAGSCIDLDDCRLK
jgi:hypothetical protein